MAHRPAQKSSGLVRTIQDLPSLVRSPLAWRVAAIVFLTVLVIEAVILVPSYFAKQRELLDNLYTTSEQWVHSQLGVFDDSGDVDVYLESLLQAEYVTGAALYSFDGLRIATAGEPVKLAENFVGRDIEPVEWRSFDGTRYERTIPAEQTMHGNPMVLRIDSTLVYDELINFILRIFGLTMLISGVVTMTTLLAIGWLVLNPLLHLRDVLASGSDASLDEGTFAKDMSRTDEIGDVMRTTASMLGDLKKFRADMGQLVLDRTMELTAANERLRNKESAIRASEARTRAIMDNSPSYIYLKSIDGRYLLVNKHVEEAIGRPASEIIGKTNQDFYDADKSAAYAEHDREVIETKCTIAREFGIPRADGTLGTSIIYKFPILGQLGDVESIGAVIIDITERKASEQRLRQREELLRMIFETAGIAIVQQDETRRLAVNDAFVELSGYSEEELLSPDLPLLIHPDDYDDVEERRKSYTRGDIPQDSGEFRLVRKDGDIRWISRNQTAIRNPDGSVERYVSFVQDITDRVNAEAEIQERERVLSKVMNNVNSGILMIDDNLVIEAFNQQMNELFQVPEGYLEVGKSLEDNIRYRARRGDFGPGDVETIVETRMRKLKGLHGATIEEHQLPHGFVETRWNIGDDGSRINVGTDITMRKANEELLRKSKIQAEHAAQSRAELVAMVSHEVRTPMNGVLGMARLLQGTPLDDSQEDMVNTIVDSGDTLVRIVSDLLDVSKLEAGKFELEPTPFILSDLLEQCVAVMMPKALEKDLKLAAEVPSDVPHVLVGDPYRLRQVLMNLISNAIRFTNDGSVEISLDVGEMTEQSVSLTFSVVDTGDGIKQEDQDRLFTAYTQGSVELARKSGGTGLGLVICSKLVTLMGGQIALRSTYGEGSTFFFNVSFPIDRSTSPSALRQASATPKGIQAASHGAAMKPLTILQIEDNATNQKVAETILRRMGHTVFSVANGQEGLDVLQTGSFDAIIMDRHMPVMDGIDATRAIRSLPRPQCDIPIIGVTAGAVEAELQVCRTAGMDVVLTKPVDGSELIAALNKLTNSGEAAAQIDATRPVLVIDDVAINRSVARQQLTNLGFHSILSESAEDGLERLKEDDIAMVLVDISMPGMSGVDFARLIRSQEPDETHLPIIAMTGYVTSEDRTGFLEAGLDGVLTKPVVLEDLEAVLHQWMPRQGQPETIAREEAVAASGEESLDTEVASSCPIDTELLGSMVGDTDPEQIKFWVGMFVDQFPPMLDALSDQVRAQDRQAVRDSAHAAKSAATSGAAMQLAQSLEYLEKQAQTLSWAEVQNTMSTIRTRFAAVADYAGKPVDDVVAQEA